MDVAKCHDCNNCFIACKDEHADNDWSPYTSAMPWHGHRWMNIERRERGENGRVDAAFLPKPCMQCGDAPCAKANPAFVQTREDGIVLFDLEKGAGQNIADTCPYDAIYYNDEKKVSQKCTFCAHLLDNGWAEPRCVHSCPTGALSFHTAEPAEFAKKIAEDGLAPYHAELGTKPHVWYKNLHRFTKNFIAGQILADGECAEGIVVKLEGGGVNAAQTTDAFGEYKFDGLDDKEYTVSAEGKVLGKATLAGASVDMGEFAV
jgi:Fe-S-cluster-containing dehydrogenase component